VRLSADNGLRSHWQSSDHTGVSAGVSLNIEELVNALTFLVFQKGPMSLLKDLGVDDLETSSDGLSIGIDKVVLGKLGICGDIMGLLKTELPVNLIFSAIGNQFAPEAGGALHMDISLDKKYPVTIAMSPLDDSTDTTEIKLAINNLKISVKNMYSIAVDANPDDESETPTTYYYYQQEDWMTDGTNVPDADDSGSNDNELAALIAPQTYDEVVEVRADIVLALKVKYKPEEQIIEVYVEGRDQQNIHLSVINGGTSYDDSVVVTTLYYLIGNVFNQFSADYPYAEGTTSADATSDSTPLSTLTIQLSPGSDGRISLCSLTDMKIDSKMKDAPLGECTADNTPCYYSDYLTMGSTACMGFDDTTDDSSKAGGTHIKGIKRADFVKALKSGLKPTIDKLKLPTELMATTLSNDVSDEDSGSTSDHCTQVGVDDPSTADVDETDSLQSNLCDFGIEEVFIDPDIQFDNDNGYIHLSTQLWLDLYDWISEPEETQ
jgi:hypothetical protein